MLGFVGAAANGNCLGNDLLGTPLRVALFTCGYECQINEACVAFVLKPVPDKNPKCFLKSACDTFTDEEGTDSYTKGESFYIFSSGSRVGA